VKLVIDTDYHTAAVPDFTDFQNVIRDR